MCVNYLTNGSDSPRWAKKYHGLLVKTQIYNATEFNRIKNSYCITPCLWRGAQDLRRRQNI